ANPRPRIRGLFRDSSTVEQTAVNRKVQGSNPCPGANFASGVAPRYCGAATNVTYLSSVAGRPARCPKKDSNSCLSRPHHGGGSLGSGSELPRTSFDAHSRTTYIGQDRSD